MISIIKTAIITIIISFVSGLLLEYYKNLAPKILCNIGNSVPLELNNKKICAYILTVRNISNKTIHQITLNIQDSQNKLKIGDAKITKGLKFDSSIKDNILDVYIPFLSKDDEFSVTLYAENQYGDNNKPVVIVRSPENFKQVDSLKQNGMISLLFNISKNIKKSPRAEETINKKNRKTLNRRNKIINNKKAVIAIVSIILLISIAVLGQFYFKNISANAQISNIKTNIQKSSIDSTESVDETTKNKETKPSTGRIRESGNTKTLAGETKDKDSNTQTNGTNENTDENKSKSAITESADTKTSVAGTDKNTDTKISTGETAGSTDTKTSTSGSTDEKKSTSGTIGNANTKISTTETAGNTDGKTSTSGTTTNTNN